METLKKPASPNAHLLAGKEEVCKNCRHFVAGEPDAGNVKAPKVGLCHRYPPTVFFAGLVPHPLNQRQGVPQFLNARVQMNEQDFCGEFSATP